MKKLLLVIMLFLSVLIAAACAKLGTPPKEAILPLASQPLPPAPQEVRFTAGDGQTLNGLYFPAATNPAPVVVLMHWYPGDQNEWTEIAYWLQNRGLAGDGDGVPWRDSAWFPAMPEGSSLAVFTFTFRNCEGGCQEPDPAGWLLDARAAVEKAAALPGVDANRVVGIGTSIGGDGAIAGCAWLLKQPGGDCLGALSLSPGGYLIDSYHDLAEQLRQAAPPRQVWCFYDENEDVAEICAALSGDHSRAEGWSDGNLHGFRLLNPDAEPNPLSLLIEFLYASGVVER